MRRLLRVAIAAMAAAAACSSPETKKPFLLPPEPPRFRAPALPLIVQSPALNVWLFGDRLTDDVPKLWNGQVKGMAGMLRIDGKTYRFLGMPGSTLPPMRQDAVRLWPTRTEIDLSAEDVHLRLEFLSPVDPQDPDLLSWPLAWIRAELSSRTGRALQLYLDLTGEWAVGSTDRRITFDGLFRIRPSQPRLLHETSSFPDWGDVHWIPVDPALSQYGVDQEVRQAFAQGSTPRRDLRYPRPANDDWPVFAHIWDLGSVQGPVVRRAILGHVRREAVGFFGQPCLSYWTKSFDDGAALVARAVAATDAVRTRALAVDAEVLSRAREAGGEPLAALAALVFRQSFAANELVLQNGRPLLFTKSFDPSGSSPVQSVETIYAAAPALLAFSPRLLALQIAPLLEALRRSDWQESYAMHDLGLYPNATGPTGTDENRIETSAMILLLAAAAHVDGDRPTLQKLARFLLEAAPLDPQTLLPVGLALATMPEHRDEALARIKKWLDLPPTHDLKPHLLMDRLLGLGLIPDAVLDRETAALGARAGKYGSASADAALRLSALGTRALREETAARLLRAYSESPSRLPAGDRLDPDTARITAGQARSTLGSLFAPILLHERSGGR